MEIKDDEATYIGPLPRHLQNGRPHMIFANKTNDFARKFRMKPSENQSFDMSELQRQLSPLTTSSRTEASVTPKRASLISSPSTTIYRLTTSDQINMFSIEGFENMFQEYINETFQVKLVYKRMKSDMTLELNGSQKSLDNAIKDIEQLFSFLSTKKFTEQIGRNPFEKKNHHPART